MKLRFLFICILFLSGHLISQNNNDVLVKIGNKVITVDEFRYRYEFTPQIERKYNDEGKAKQELLYTLIAENLFAIEAEDQGFDTLSIMKNNYLPLEKMYVRDALYKQEISSKVEFDLKKYNEGIARANYKLFADFIYGKEEAPIKAAHKFLESNDNFDSLVTLLINVEYVAEPYEVTFGKMHISAEDSIYKLRIGEFTNPIESPDGWYIFRLLSKIPADYKSNDQKYSMVKKVVDGRIEDSLYVDFRANFFKDQKVNTDGILFWYFAEEVQKVAEQIKSINSIAEDEKITITNDDFTRLKNNLNPDSLAKPFIKFENNPITFGQFFRDFSFEGFFTNTTDLNQIAAQIKSRVRRQIELELLTRDGYKTGIESLPEVKESTEIWKENYLATLLLKDIVLNSELTDEDIKRYLSEEATDSLSETKVNIIEILTDSLEVIKEALALSENNSALSDYAKIHTKREWTKKNGGEFGYFSVQEYGEIGKIAESMEIGDIYGPLQTPEGFSVFKLIGKIENKIDLASSDISEDIRLKIRYQKVMDKLENLASDLAEKHGVQINEELLKSLNLMNAQMVVYRHMGFGGRLQAYPYSTPFYKWKEKWEQKKKELL